LQNLREKSCLVLGFPRVRIVLKKSIVVNNFLIRFDFNPFSFIVCSVAVEKVVSLKKLVLDQL